MYPTIHYAKLFEYNFDISFLKKYFYKILQMGCQNDPKMAVTETGYVYRYGEIAKIDQLIFPF